MAGRHVVRVTSRAEAEIRAAAAWWEANRPAAPGAIREDLERAFALLSVQPRVGATARNPQLTGVRRLHLGRVRYHLYYRVVDDPASVEVLAFWHSNRGSDPNP